MKKLVSLILACLLCLTALPVLAEETAAAPKYVFLFIGDGMSYPQFQAAADYLGALADDDAEQALPSVKDDERGGAVLDGPKALNFMNFPMAGSAVTFDSCSFAPDSASTATSIATGHKTYSGMINVDETGAVSFETIAEKLHSQKGWKIGIISSVNINHATPAAFYAHQVSRNSYYEIGLEMIDSGFEYFAGGALKKVNGAEGDKESLYDLAEKAGYKVTFTQADAVQVAIDFAREHPAETLIVVTGDHETGGLTIGYAGTDYDTYLDTLSSQKISYAQFDEQYVAGYKENQTPFEDAMKDVEELFGLKLAGDEGDRLVLTEYETERLKAAYELVLGDAAADSYTQEQSLLYGGYNPFSVTVTHILNNKSGVDFTSYSHTGLPVAVFAQGAGEDAFTGYYDNTEIYNKLAALVDVKYAAAGLFGQLCGADDGVHGAGHACGHDAQLQICRRRDRSHRGRFLRAGDGRAPDRHHQRSAADKKEEMK